MLIKQVAWHIWMLCDLHIHDREQKRIERLDHIRMSVWQKLKKKTNQEREFVKRVYFKSHHRISHRKSRLNFVYAIGVGKNRKRIPSLQTSETRQSTVCCQSFKGYVRKRSTIIWINYFVLKYHLKVFSAHLQIHRVVRSRYGIWLRHLKRNLLIGSYICYKKNRHFQHCNNEIMDRLAWSYISSK